MLPEEKIEELRAKHGRIKVIVFNGWTLVIRAPQRKEVQDHMLKANDPAQKPFADEQLLQLIVECVATKDGRIAEGPAARPVFLEMLSRWPYISHSPTFSGPVGKLAGLVEDEEEKA